MCEEGCGLWAYYRGGDVTVRIDLIKGVASSAVALKNAPVEENSAWE